MALRHIAFALGILFAARACTAEAAEISVEDLKGSSAHIIFIEGEIKTGDHQKFARLAAQYDEVGVVLNSPGGLTTEAIEIGKAIRIRGYSTFVTDGFQCDSSCALIWLAGKTKFIGKNSKVGFHATFIDENGTRRESGAGNAIVGGYLALLGISQDAIFYMSAASPEKLNYLNINNAKTFGIDVKIFPAEDEPTSSSSNSKGSRLYAMAGNWRVAVDDSLGHGCFIAVSYEGGATLRIGYDMRDGKKGYILLFGENWASIEKSKEYNVTITFGSNTPWAGNMTGVDMDGLRGLYLLFSDPAFLKELSSSAGLKAAYGGRTIMDADLSNSAEAVSSLNRCQNQTNTEDPFRQ